MTLAPPSRTRVRAVIGEPPNGVSYVRFLQPFAHLEPLGYELGHLGERMTVRRAPNGGFELDSDWLGGASVLIFPQMVATPRLPDGQEVLVVGPLCREARRRGIVVVHSLDDGPEHLDSSNPVFDRSDSWRENVALLAEHADAYFVTTPTLAEDVTPRGKPVFILPNAVDPGVWGERGKNEGGPVRVGWAGSASHLDDLLMLASALVRVAREVEFELILFGLTDLPLATQLEQVERGFSKLTPAQRTRAKKVKRLVRDLGGVRWRHVPFCPVRDYFRALPALALDLGLCPLLDTPFNRRKSALKFYEYAVTGTMTIASDVVPYAGEVSVTVPNDPEAWAAAIVRYVTDAGARERELALQREFVLAERDIRKLRDRWADALAAVRPAHAIGIV